MTSEGSSSARSAIPALVGLALFLGALEVLRRELAAVTWPALSAGVLATPPSRLVMAVLLTALNYAVLTGYDFIGFATIKKSLAWWRIASASFLAYAIANNVGFALVSGASVRYRFYRRWHLTGDQISRIVFSYTITFWLGLLALGGLSLVLVPWPAQEGAMAAPLGWLLIAISLGYVMLTAVTSGPIVVGRFAVALPPPRLALAQLALSSADWALAGAVLFVLLPPSAAPFAVVLSAFLAAQLLGLASHVPGGVGVFEGLLTLLLQPYLDSSVLLPALVVYRAIYYLLPLTVALVGLVADETRQRRSKALRASRLVGRITRQATPNVLAIVTFGAGLVLLFSGATPAAGGRLAALARVLPVSVVEMSHFTGSLVGVALLLLSQGLSRRLDAAYYLASMAMCVGIATSVLKGADYEEAIFLGLTLLALRRVRPAFDRKAALFDTPLSAGWIVAIVAALCASVWLGFFAFKHVEYSNSLWWEFEMFGEAPRFLRASVGAAVLVLFTALIRLLRYAPHDVTLPTDADLIHVQTIIETQQVTYPYLACLRDKGLLFTQDRTAFVMYAVQGRTWVAFGDPVGPPERAAELIRAFLERCDDFGGTPVFYEVRKEYLHHYADYGFTFLKLGEEARVDLRQFTLEGAKSARLRQALRRLHKDGATFRIVAAAEVMAIMDQLARVSDDWLAARPGGEKGFSLGFFDRAYLARFPVAVIERAGRIEAFANLWPGGSRGELSVDLMRYHHDAPKGVMDTLMVCVMQWGQAQGFRWFALGMAPMSGFEQSAVSPLWARVGRLFYEHGDELYHFRGLREYKEKFDPVWEPRYLAHQGGLALPRALADISALVAGGYRRIFLK